MRLRDHSVLSRYIRKISSPLHIPVQHDGPAKRLFLNAISLPTWLMHNHPSGDPSPSQADIQMTKAIIDIANPLGIAVHDHIIVGKSGHASLRGMRLI
ncbi:JAB domain-containing protein [Bradyrhizobium sp. SBR1B]|uniref:JAB domain-containing protein n=1 Tax=Bradyrhizobium sp. SBR1B TaxID=2663836 RepID=UPI003908B341